jgi:hypothetical protein
MFLAPGTSEGVQAFVKSTSINTINSIYTAPDGILVKKLHIHESFGLHIALWLQIVQFRKQGRAQSIHSGKKIHC